MAVECRLACPMGGCPAEAGVCLIGDDVLGVLLLEMPLRSADPVLKLVFGGSGSGRVAAGVCETELKRLTGEADELAGAVRGREGFILVSFPVMNS